MPMNALEKASSYVYHPMLPSRHSFRVFVCLIPASPKILGVWLKFVRRSWIKNTHAIPSDLFAAADTNGDGKMTFAEWRDSPVRSTSKDDTNSMLSEIWAKYDTANVGYLTEDEAINRKPATN